MATISQLEFQFQRAGLCPACFGYGFSMGRACTWCGDRNLILARQRAPNLRGLTKQQIDETKRLYFSEFKRLMDAGEQNGNYACLRADGTMKARVRELQEMNGKKKET